MELQLAAQLGVSRTPIREAIRMLEQEGLAVTVPRKGAEVAKMTLKGMEDVLEIREALDILACQLACERITEEQLADLEEKKIAFENSLKTGNVKAIAATDVAFHDVIYDATNNPKLVNMLNNLRENMYRYRIEYLKDSNYYDSLVREHKEILEAIESGNKEKAGICMRDHIDNQQLAVISKLK